MDDFLKAIRKTNEYARSAAEGLISDVEDYVDTGSYMFNALLSGSIYGGLPGNKIVGFAGPSSTGKTMLTLYIIKNFLDMNKNNFIVYFDSEAAIDTKTLKSLNMDLTRFFHVPIASVEDFHTQAIGLVEEVKEYNAKNEKEKKHIMMILDSLGQLPSRKESEDAKNDDFKSDMGRRAASIKSAMRTLTMKLALLHIPLIITTHTYDSMNAYASKGISGGSGYMYAGSEVIELTARKDKNDDGNEVVGVIMTATSRKSRITPQHKKVEIKLDFKKGLDKYHGLLDFAVENGIFKKDGKKIETKLNNDRYFAKEIEKDPVKFFPKEVLDEIESAIKVEFNYGGPEISLDEEVNVNIAFEDNE